MNWPTKQFNATPRMLRQFAAGWLVFFAASGAYQWLVKGHVKTGIVFMVIGGLGGMGGWIWPRLIQPFFTVAMCVAFPIGWCLSQVLLTVMFYVILTPVAVFFRLKGRDLLMRKRDQKRGQVRTTYWHEMGGGRDMHRYFRQY